MALTWHIADDVAVIHRLILDCDLRTAQETSTATPNRRVTSTQRLVNGRHVWLGVIKEQPVVTVTVGPIPSFDASAAKLPDAHKPWYMQRLAVATENRDSLTGFHAVRHAVAVAALSGADVLRAQANPRLPVLTLLIAVGFRNYRTETVDNVSSTYLQLTL